MSNDIAQFIPLIIVAGAIWLILKYLRNKKGISSKDDGRICKVSKPRKICVSGSNYIHKCNSNYCIEYNQK